MENDTVDVQHWRMSFYCPPAPGYFFPVCIKHHQASTAFVQWPNSIKICTIRVTALQKRALQGLLCLKQMIQNGKLELPLLNLHWSVLPIGFTDKVTCILRDLCPQKGGFISTEHYFWTVPWSAVKWTTVWCYGQIQGLGVLFFYTIPRWRIQSWTMTCWDSQTKYF